MNENESRPLTDAEIAEYWEATARLYCEVGESYQAKAAALDKILAAWGMTWYEYKQQSGTDATTTGREPNAENQAVQSRDHVEHPA